MTTNWLLPDRVLVIGGCGFLGHHIVQHLLDAGVAHVSVLDLRTDRNRLANVKYYDGDITSEADVDAVLSQEKPVALIHTASPLAAAHVPNSVYDKVTIHGTQKLLERAGHAGTVQAFVYTSSASVVHDYAADLRFADETWPVLRIPDTPDYYGHTKGVAETAVLAANRKYGNMLTAAIRPAGIFGEGDNQMIPGAIAAYRTGKTKVQLGDNTNLWDWTYVGNVAHAHLLAVQALTGTGQLKVKPLDYERVDGEAFNVTNDAPIPFWDVMRKVWTEAGWDGRPTRPWVLSKGLGVFIAHLLNWIVWIFSLGRRLPTGLTRGMILSTTTRTFNIEKAKKRLGYEALVGLEEGLRRGVQDFLAKEQPNKADKKEQ